MNNEADLPIIDLSTLGTSTAADDAIASAVEHAVTERGFMYVLGHGLEPALVGRAFASASDFFARPRVEKDRFGYTDIEANFGFQGIEVESLDPKNKPDLKEAFTMRNALAASPEGWPDAQFRDTALQFYQSSLSAAYRLMNVFARCLDLPADFFTGRHSGQNVTLRYLHYPANLPAKDPEQLGAGAHTDYGSLTLLFQDDVGGLEVRGIDGEWYFAPPVAGAAVINTGDLMERWTNGRFISTAHRVRPITGTRDRYSIAFFVDPDSDVEIECIPSCRTALAPALYPPITAGEHIRQKIAATHANS